MQQPNRKNVGRQGNVKSQAVQKKGQINSGKKPSKKTAVVQNKNNPRADVVANAVGKTVSKKKIDYGKGGRVDIPMVVIVLVLLALGITMMFSAGHAWSYEKNNNSFYYVQRQLIATGLGLAGMIVLANFDYHRFEAELRFGKNGKVVTLSHIALAATILINLLTIPFGVSNIENGPRRWLKVPVVGTFQPSDLLKVGVILFMAYYLQKNKDRIRSFKVGLVRPALLMAVMVLIMMSQSHLSGLLIIFMVTAVMMFVGGVNIKPAIAVIPLLIVLIFIAIKFTGFVYYFDRLNYMDPLSDPGDKSYQNFQSALAIGSGGVWGKGFGNSSQKYFYLPEAPNDFVYAILIEEFGLIGGILVIMMFLLFVMRGFQIAREANDKFGCLMVTGITFQIGIQALLNIGVNLCCIPNTGVSLPFFSYGGTALTIQLCEIGLLLSVSRWAGIKQIKENADNGG